mgnify:FL=1
MSEQTSDEKYLLQSVNNALAIIDVLCEHDNLGLAELASYMNLGKVRSSACCIHCSVRAMYPRTGIQSII